MTEQQVEGHQQSYLCFCSSVPFRARLLAKSREWARKLRQNAGSEADSSSCTMQACGSNRHVIHKAYSDATRDGARWCKHIGVLRAQRSVQHESPSTPQKGVVRAWRERIGNVAA
eukprot:1577624-Rhodomonas_salina.1